jgi:hypothetical protein
MRGTNGADPFPADHPQSELLRALVLCHPGWSRLGSITFAPEMRFSPSWRRWKETVFVPVILPAIEGAQFAFARGDCQGLGICDKRIDAALPPNQKQASQRAGAALAQSYSVPKSEKLWARYRALVISGELPGHLAVLCAIRGTAFHLAQFSILSAYIFLEAKGGLQREEVTMLMSMVRDCLGERHDIKPSKLRAA